MINLPKGYIKKKSSTVPFGYQTSEIHGYLKPIPEQQQILQAMPAMADAAQKVSGSVQPDSLLAQELQGGE